MISREESIKMISSYTNTLGSCRRRQNFKCLRERSKRRMPKRPLRLTKDMPKDLRLRVVTF